MKDTKFIFLSGLHRSGTSLLHEIFREHPDISGFSGTAVAEDEGQHLQSVYKPAKAFGGPGKFAFDNGAYMDESHPLATHESAVKIFKQWSDHFDLSCKYLIEKSPPNLIRTRFLQKLYPNCKFIVILRHPLAVSYATQKWCETSINSLLEHSILAYELFLKDMKHLSSVYVLRYEEFILDPQKEIENIFSYLEISPININHVVRSNVNDAYFSMWENDRKKILYRIFNGVSQVLEHRSNKFGYSINNYKDLLPLPWSGAHNQG